MRYFYAMMCWMAEFEYVIANSTGRNPKYVRQARDQWNYWRSQRELYEVTRG